MVKFNFENSSINERMIYEMESVVSENHKKLHDNPNIETDFRGWIDLPENYNKEEFENTKIEVMKIDNHRSSGIFLENPDDQLIGLKEESIVYVIYK